MVKKNVGKKMRLIRIENISEQKFEKIFAVIVKHIPFSLVNQGYSYVTRTGFFNFWDSDYIPESLRKYIVQPPLSRENREAMNNELEKIFD